MRTNNKKLAPDKKPLLVLSRRAVAGWIGMLLLVCAWMFLIGVLVGRGTVPMKFDVNRIQEKVAASWKIFKTQSKDQPEPEAAPGEDQTTLDFYEALKDNREDTKIPARKPSPIISQKIAPAPEAVTPQIPVKTEAETPVSRSGIETKPAEAESKTEPARPPPKETTALPSASEPTGSAFTIQAASVRDAQEADRLVAELKKQGYPAYRMIGIIPGSGVWYRVRIGEFKSPEDARSTLAKLKNAGVNPILVAK
jgi:DedD protein